MYSGETGLELLDVQVSRPPKCRSFSRSIRRQINESSNFESDLVKDMYDIFISRERFNSFRCIFTLQPFKEIKKIWKVQYDIMLSDKVFYKGPDRNIQCFVGSHYLCCHYSTLLL